MNKDTEYIMHMGVFLFLFYWYHEPLWNIYESPLCLYVLRNAATWMLIIYTNLNIYKDDSVALL